MNRLYFPGHFLKEGVETQERYVISEKLVNLCSSWFVPLYFSPFVAYAFILTLTLSSFSFLFIFLIE